MENSKEILHLPDKVLLEILSLVPERFEIASVCKKFYQLVCEMDKNKMKLSLGQRHGVSIDRTAIINSKREFDTMNVWMDFKTADDVESLKNIFQRHGANIKNLTWCNWSTFALTEGDVIGMLSCLPNLEKLTMSSWSTKFIEVSTEVKKLSFVNLKKLEVSESEDFIYEFLTRALPEGTLKELKLRGPPPATEVLSSFCSKQLSITNLDVQGNFIDDHFVKGFKLTHLRLVLDENETPVELKAFLKSLIASQPDITHLDCLSDQDYSFLFVDDPIFEEISKLTKLQVLKMNIDGVSSNAIQNFSRLSNLTSLDVKTNRETSLEVFNELSMIKSLPLEVLTLQLWTFEIPAQTYQQIGQNFKQLKSLTITLGTWHKVNFFVEAFPTLESLSIRFGESNNKAEFSQVYDRDGHQHKSIKHLKLQFWGSEALDEGMFFNFLKSFPHLQSLDIHSKFPLTGEFFTRLSACIEKLNSLKMSTIDVSHDEKFSPELLESFRELKKKLKFCSLTLANVEEVMLEMGTESPTEQLRPQRTEKFTFKPLIDGLKNDFKINESSLANIRVRRSLVLSHGREKKE